MRWAICSTVGGGLIIAVGSAKGLPNPAPFDKKKKVEVTVGAPGAGFPTWTEYGFCSPPIRRACASSALAGIRACQPPESFNLETVAYPTQDDVAGRAHAARNTSS